MIAKAFESPGTEILRDHENLPNDTVPYDTQVAIAASALSIKGYGPVKERAVTAWREHVAGLRGSA
jgi:indolepyruvate ferredoxin oxidoreductase